MQGFPGGSEVKAFACNAGDLGSIPGSGRSPGEGNGNLLQYSCLENPMDGEAWWATVHEVAESDKTEHFTLGSVAGQVGRWEELLGKLVCVLICSRGIYYVAITGGANVFSDLSIDYYLGFISVRASIALSFSRFLKPNEFWVLPLLLWIDVPCLLTLLYL